MWFPAVGQSDPMRFREAIKICSGCPVQTPCLNEAIANHDYVGIWGGTNERERRSLRELLQANPDVSPRDLIPKVRTLKRRRGWRGPSRGNDDK